MEAPVKTRNVANKLSLHITHAMCRTYLRNVSL
jgi:hypothetical protein